MSSIAIRRWAFNKWQKGTVSGCSPKMLKEVGFDENFSQFLLLVYPSQSVLIDHAGYWRIQGRKSWVPGRQNRHCPCTFWKVWFSSWWSFGKLGCSCGKFFFPFLWTYSNYSHHQDIWHQMFLWEILWQNLVNVTLGLWAAQCFLSYSHLCFWTPS